MIGVTAAVTLLVMTIVTTAVYLLVMTVVTAAVHLLAMTVVAAAVPLLSMTVVAAAVPVLAMTVVTAAVTCNEGGKELAPRLKLIVEQASEQERIQFSYVKNPEAELLRKLYNGTMDAADS